MKRAASLRRERLSHPFRELTGLAVPKRSPRPGDWLAEHEERGQSVADFVAQRHARPAPSRRAIDLLPVGDFDPDQKRLVGAVADYLERFFGLPVRVREAVPADSIPSRARRYRPDLGWSQLDTGYFLKELLPGLRDTTAFAMIALTREDLFPDTSWNFVFATHELTAEAAAVARAEKVLESRP